MENHSVPEGISEPHDLEDKATCKRTHLEGFCSEICCCEGHLRLTVLSVSAKCMPPFLKRGGEWVKFLNVIIGASQGSQIWEESSMDQCQSRGKPLTTFRAIGPCSFSRAAKRGGGFHTGGFPDLDLSFLFCPFLSFFVLFGTFPIFLGFSRFARGWSGDFPDLSFSSFLAY